MHSFCFLSSAVFAQLLGCYEIPQHCIRRVKNSASDMRAAVAPAVSAEEGTRILAGESLLPVSSRPDRGREGDDSDGDGESETDTEGPQPTVSASSAVSASPGVRVERVGEELSL